MLAWFLTHSLVGAAFWMLHKFAGPLLVRWLERRAGSLAWRLLRRLV